VFWWISFAEALEPGRVILHIGKLTTADMTEMEPFTPGFESTINQPCARASLYQNPVVRRSKNEKDI
jgi:hypothetical protein